MDHRQIVIFDGVCNFCNGAINFIIKHDPNGVFAFTPMQSALGTKLMAKHQISQLGLDTILLVKDGKPHIFSDAAFEIAKDLSGFWSMLRVLKIIPRPVRDYFYRLFARNRYNLFGKRDQCMAPTPEVQSRFIGV